jgi:hypothetical protein
LATHWPICTHFISLTARALKREAARFRVHGFNAAGEVVAELTLRPV